VTPLHSGFADELTKVAVAGAVVKSLAKHPVRTLLGGSVLIGAGLAGRAAYKSGLQGGQKPRYLAASVDPRTGRAIASRAAYLNWHNLFSHKPSKKQIARLSKHYKERAFRRS